MKNITKTSFFIVMLLIGTLTAEAQFKVETPPTQDENPKCYVYMGNFTFKQSTSNAVTSLLTGVATGTLNTQNPDFAPSVKAGVLKAFNAVKRVVVKEESLNESITEFANKTNNKCYIVDGTITNMSTGTSLTKNNSTEYLATVTFTLNMKDAKTNDVVASAQFSKDGYAFAPYSNASNALTDAMTDAAHSVYKYFSKVFCVRGYVVEHGNATTNKQKELYINLGSDIGVGQGDHYGVYTVQTIAGREAKTKIGEIKVSSVMGGDISLCKVTKGGANIKTACEKDAKLLVISE